MERCECDGERYCDKHLNEQQKLHEWMRGLPKSAITGVLSEEEEQDLRDAGRGHLLP
jgi:hypothetical protein